jgi:hypothetical protein
MNYFSRKIGLLVLLLGVQIALLAQNTSNCSITQELLLLQKKLVPDKRVAVLDISVNDTIQPVVIVGETDLPDAKAQILQLFADKKIAVIDSIRLLPNTSLGSKTWALATLSASNIRALPDHAAELVSQAEMGTPMKLLDVKDNWYRVQTPEHYIGWMDAGCLTLLTSQELELWKKANRYIYNKLTGNVLQQPCKHAEIVSDLVLGDLLVVEARKCGYLSVRLPDGRTGYVKKKQCRSFADWSQSEPNAQSVIAIAKQMMGTPYLWGGTTSKGVDCSGFMKMAFYSQGVILARDASQQARYGEPIDFKNIANLQPCDLLFFGKSAQRITHVGMYLGNGDFIHSSGRVHISSIIPTDPKYVPTRNNVAACRILNSLHAEGITLVKEHPWYVTQP